MLFGEQARDGRQAPILVGFMKFGRVESFGVQHLLQANEVFFVSNSQVNVRGMVVRWTTVRKCVFNCGVAGLNSLLGEWDIAPRDGVQVRLGGVGNLCLHDCLSVGD